MADAQPNQMNQLIAAQLLGPQTTSDLNSAQQKQALGNALLQEGITPIDTSNRSVGGVGYRISPLEGLAKIAQTLAGRYDQNQANNMYVKALSGAQNNAAQVPSGGDMWVNADGSPTRLAQMEMANGNRAVQAHVDAQKTTEMRNLGPLLDAKNLRDIYPDAAPVAPPVSGSDAAPISTGSSIPPPPGANAMPMAPDAQAIPSMNGSDLQPGIPGLPANHPMNNILETKGGVTSIRAPSLYNPDGTPKPAGLLKAQMDIYKAAQQKLAEAPGAGAQTNAEDTGKNSAEAAKTLNVMSANLPVLQKRISDMKEANNTSSLGPWNDQEGNGLASKIADYKASFGGDATASTSNAKLQQLTAQNVLPELGPALAQAGIKGNKFLETLSSTASGVDLSKSKEAREAQIDGLLKNYVQNMKSTYQQVKQYGGDPTTVFPDPPSVVNAIKLGIISRAEGEAILQKNHGFR